MRQHSYHYVSTQISQHLSQKLPYLTSSNKSKFVGGPKNSRNCYKKNVKYLYNFETLVPFEVLPLRLDAAIPEPLPMLETLSKIFNGNAVEDRQRFSLNLCNIRKLPALQNLLHPWEPNKT